MRPRGCARCLMNWCHERTRCREEALAVVCRWPGVLDASRWRLLTRIFSERKMTLTRISVTAVCLAGWRMRLWDLVSL